MKSIGIFRTSPTLNGSLMRRDGGTTQWWLIIDCDPELGRYLRHQYIIAHHKTVKVQASLWGDHVSIIRGEEPPNKDRWKALEGVKVELDVDLTVHETAGYLWVPVQCELALQHREELGLPRAPVPPLHLTIGNLNVS